MLRALEAGECLSAFNLYDIHSLFCIADLHNRVSKDLRTAQQHLNLHELIITVHVIIDLRNHAAKCNAPLQLMHVCPTAGRKRFSLLSEVTLIASEQRLYKPGIARYAMRLAQLIIIQRDAILCQRFFYRINIALTLLLNYALMKFRKR